mmetsp:Transcript_21742/g.55426  ORF Transcript_21742/g.55426 Transcript_21742/m.55426 type:complete len:200 (+) Transcript_21742:850-1449(+)
MRARAAVGGRRCHEHLGFLVPNRRGRAHDHLPSARGDGGRRPRGRRSCRGGLRPEADRERGGRARGRALPRRGRRRPGRHGAERTLRSDLPQGRGSRCVAGREQAPGAEVRRRGGWRSGPGHPHLLHRRRAGRQGPCGQADEDAGQQLGEGQGRPLQLGRPVQGRPVRQRGRRRRRRQGQRRRRGRRRSEGRGRRPLQA